MMKKFLNGIVLSLVLLVLSTNLVLAQTKVFSADELAKYNGKDGAKSYTSYQGVVYDVTDSTLWKLGEHFGLQAGKDLTADMANAPHGAEVFTGFTVVGNLEGFEKANDTVTNTNVVDSNSGEKTETTDQTPWYAKRIRFMGFSILGWTGILLGIFFVLTFGTCFALPWAQLPLPWKGTKIGSDSLDASGTHMKWSSVHKYFVWVTVTFGIVHGIIGFLQMLGIYL